MLKYETLDGKVGEVPDDVPREVFGAEPIDNEPNFEVEGIEGVHAIFYFVEGEKEMLLQCREDYLVRDKKGDEKIVEIYSNPVEIIDKNALGESSMLLYVGFSELVHQYFKDNFEERVGTVILKEE